MQYQASLMSFNISSSFVIFRCRGKILTSKKISIHRSCIYCEFNERKSRRIKGDEGKDGWKYLKSRMVEREKERNTPSKWLQWHCRRHLLRASQEAGREKKLSYFALLLSCSLLLKSSIDEPDAASKSSVARWMKNSWVS